MYDSLGVSYDLLYASANVCSVEVHSCHCIDDGSEASSFANGVAKMRRRKGKGNVGKFRFLRRSENDA